MSGGHENVEPRPAESQPRKYYWPWECRYYWPWQPRIHPQPPNPRPRFRISLLALMLIVTAAAFGSCCLGVVFRRVEGKRLSAAEANRRLWLVHSYCRVPEDSTNIELRASYPGATVSFDMPFSGFARYCIARGWYLRQIDPTWPETMVDVDGKVLTISDGYYYRPPSGRGAYKAYYDRSRRRAWIYYTNDND
jgi:hypothetical protein